MNRYSKNKRGRACYGDQQRFRQTEFLKRDGSIRHMMVQNAKTPYTQAQLEDIRQNVVGFALEESKGL